MGGGTHSNLWTGYDRYESHRGTLTASQTETITFAAPVASLLIEHKGNLTDSLYATIDTVTTVAGEPSDDGTGDSDNEMIEITEAFSQAIDVYAVAVKLRSSAAIRYQVIGLRV